ncbi:hypothetical protein ScPMuIL_015674 [Solemya velum]
MFKVLRSSSLGPICRTMVSDITKAPPAAVSQKAKEKPGSIISTPTTSQKASADSYQNPEYYKYNRMSFYDMDVQMQKSRLPQPSSVSS